MGLPESYTVKTSAIPEYFQAMLEAQPPERFSLKFLENLGFRSTNDRLFIGILKDLGFLDSDGVPQQRYYDFLDRTRSSQVLAEGIREAYSDLFAIKTNANELSAEDAKNKLRTLYAGKKSDLVIGRIAKTFESLCHEADFSQPSTTLQDTDVKAEATLNTVSTTGNGNGIPHLITGVHPKDRPAFTEKERVRVDALQYHINIVLPESRDQAVFDAIFRSLREHLG